MQRFQDTLRRGAADVDKLVDECRDAALPLTSDTDLDPLMDRIGDSHYVLLGEASHGTSDYYTWRLRLSKRLIQEKGFSFIAVEGDWPDCYRVNRYVKGMPDSGASAYDVLHAFERWPTWMWANWEIVELAEWLRQRNDGLPEERKAGFYGLDVYSLWDSLHAVLEYLKGVDGTALETAKKAFACFEPYSQDVVDYARATVGFMPTSCEQQAVAMLSALRREMPDAAHDGREAYFVAEQNALVVKNAETYYRAMIRGGAASWNVRDHHMVETLERLMRFHGQEARCIVWEHNTHIGDARYTDMARAGMENVGQLVRERRERDGVVLVGFSSHRGSVIAGYEWGAPMRRMEVPIARDGTWEDILHRAGGENKLLIFDERNVTPDWMETRGHRAIGVVYDPDYERFGNYVPTVLPRRYDALLYIDQSEALHPLHMQARQDAEPPETYPWAA